MPHLILPVLLLILSACSTVQGAGEDLSTAGDYVSETAQDAKQKM